MSVRIPARKLLAVTLILAAASVCAQHLAADISGYLPEGGQIAGWTAEDTPQNYRGDDLFMMIDGGAEIYHEYGFDQVVSAHYVNGRGNSITVEIYEMESPAAAYGMFSFKTGDDGKTLAIGQDALLEDYYLNFWKGNMLVTIVGSDADQFTTQAVIGFARAIDKRLPAKGQRPALAEMLLNEPTALSMPTYIRGPIGAMNNYMFDTDDIFLVQEGLTGLVDDCRAMVFRYQDENESTEIYKNAIDRLSDNPRFTDGVRNGDQYALVDRDQAFLMINRTGQYIVIVIGHGRDTVKALSGRLTRKLNSGSSH